jgi:FkbM family methyltransferase
MTFSHTAASVRPSPLSQPVVVPSPAVHVRRSWKALFDDEREAEALARCWESRDAQLPPVRLRPKALLGREVWIRHATTDAQVFDDTFVGRYHEPPRVLDQDAVVVDLGGNIGLTAVHFAATYSGGRVVCVEMDPGNATLAARNLGAFGTRCTVVQAAVWSSDGHLEYTGTEEWGLRVATLEGHTPTPVSNHRRTARAISMPTLLREQAIDRIDFLKVDIEGAEAVVLTDDATWLNRVNTIKVEHHEPATRESMAGVLERFGFRVSDDTRHPRCVVGMRD